MWYIRVRARQGARPFHFQADCVACLPSSIVDLFRVMWATMKLRETSWKVRRQLQSAQLSWRLGCVVCCCVLAAFNRRFQSANFPVKHASSATKNSKTRSILRVIFRLFGARVTCRLAADSRPTRGWLAADFTRSPYTYKFSIYYFRVLTDESVVFGRLGADSAPTRPRVDRERRRTT